MKKNKEFPYLILAFLVLWCPVFMGVWNKDKPSSSTSLRNSNPEMLANQSALETSFGAHHEFSTGGTNSGDNLRIKFNAPISTPTNAANKSFMYEKDVSAVVELHWLDESGNELQMTSGGDLFSSAGLTVTSASTFNGSITLGAGDDLIGSSTSDITFNTNKFTVAGATGNTVVAGTLDVTGVGTLGDSSQMATSAAPTADADIANKLYIDNAVQIVNTTDGAVATGTTVMPSDDSIPQNTEGDEYMTLAITPVNTAHLLKIDVVLNFAVSGSGVFSMALFQDSTANALAAVATTPSATNALTQVTLTHYMTAGTTSETTFKIRAGSENSVTTTFNGEGGGRRFGGVASSSITITELRG